MFHLFFQGFGIACIGCNHLKSNCLFILYCSKIFFHVFKFSFPSKISFKKLIFSSENSLKWTTLLSILTQLLNHKYCEPIVESPVDAWRPWHDSRAIARARAITSANQEKGGLTGWGKARPKVKLRGLISPAPNSK